MRDYLIILLPVNEDSSFQWARITDDAIIETGTSTLSEMRNLSQSNLPITLILPGQNIQTFEHTLPKMSRREQAKAVLFSIEDSLSTPLDTLHVALHDGDAKTVSVIGSAFMDNIQDWAKDNDLNITEVYADYQSLIGLDGNPIALSDRIISPALLGHTLDLDWYKGVTQTVDQHTLFETIKNNRANATNLMQGAFAPRSNFSAVKTPLIQFGGLVAALAMASLFLNTMQARSLSAQADDVKRQTAALYTAQTGQAAPSNPARTVTLAARNSANVPTQFLSLNAIAFKALSSFEDVTIDRLSYQNSRNEIQLRLVYPSFERAEAVQKAMEEAGGVFTPGGVREQNGRFVGEAVLKIQGGAP